MSKFLLASLMLLLISNSYADGNNLDSAEKAIEKELIYQIKDDIKKDFVKIHEIKIEMLQDNNGLSEFYQGTIWYTDYEMRENPACYSLSAKFSVFGRLSTGSGILASACSTSSQPSEPVEK